MRAWFRVDDLTREQQETVHDTVGPSNGCLPSTQAGPNGQSSLTLRGARAPEAPLSSEALRALYRRQPTADVARLIREIYRLQSLARRTAFFLDTALSRGAMEHLDITSQILLNGLAAALKAEPYIASIAVDRPPDGKPQAPAVATYSAPPGYQSAGLNASFPEGFGGLAVSYGGAVCREKLFTWRLSPEPGRADDTWQASCYRGLVVARAGDPIRARQLAAERFKGEAATAHVKSPWCMRRLVRVELLENSPFDRVEQAGVVYP